MSVPLKFYFLLTLCTERMKISFSVRENINVSLNVIDSDEEYDELDDRYEDQYWTTDNTLVVEEAINFSNPKTKFKTPEDNINRFAVNKLVRQVIIQQNLR